MLNKKKGKTKTNMDTGYRKKGEVSKVTVKTTTGTRLCS